MVVLMLMLLFPRIVAAVVATGLMVVLLKAVLLGAASPWSTAVSFVVNGTTTVTGLMVILLDVVLAASPTVGVDGDIVKSMASASLGATTTSLVSSSSATGTGNRCVAVGFDGVATMLLSLSCSSSQRGRFR